MTLQWSTLADATYEVCWDTSNNATCNGTWVSTGAATHHVVSSLAPGTYYWQVRAMAGANSGEADATAWWSFTVGAGGFGKLGPQHGQTGLGSNLTLQWAGLPDSGYWVCWDTTDNSSCDGMWWPNGASTAKPVVDLPPGTYYWQVKAMTPSGEAIADGGTWWRFTVHGGAGTFTKSRRRRGSRASRRI